jgi:hypothetical protein
MKYVQAPYAGVPQNSNPACPPSHRDMVNADIAFSGEVFRLNLINLS